jgi:peroxisomal membrane protein 4
MNFSLHELTSVLKGLRNGVQYGGKVRFVHSIVITLLFKSINVKQMKTILKNAYEHGKNLGLFVLLYKSLCIFL